MKRFAYFAALACLLAATACHHATSPSNPSSEVADAQSVDADQAALSLDDLTFAAGDDSSSVNDDFTLPTTGTNGSAITWTASPAGVIAIDEATGQATVTRQGTDTTVTLKATIQKGGATQTKDLVVTVKAGSWSYTVTFDSQSATVAASPASMTVESPATTVSGLPTAPTRTNSLFGGWWTGIGGTGTQFTASTPVTASLTVYAKWTTLTARTWWTVASSADGSILFAGEQNTGKIHRSTDSGQTWSEAYTVAGKNVQGISCSSDGSKVIASIYQDYLYVSTDSGSTWTARGSSDSWNAVWCSPDGSTLMAGTTGTYIYRSTDDGASWTEYTGPGAHSWVGFAGNTAGSRILAAHTMFDIYATTNSGNTWNPLATTFSCAGFAGSSDGLKLVSINQGPNPVGGIYTSTDGGSNWTHSLSTHYISWRGVASSADGTKLVAAAYSGTLWTSSDSGASWTERDASAKGWLACASSSDGTRLVAVVYGGQIWRSSDSGVSWNIAY